MTCSTAFSPSPLFFLTDAHRCTRRRGSPVFINQIPALNALRWSKPGLLRAYASMSERNPDLSWVSADSTPEFNGWAVMQFPAAPNAKKKGLPKFVIGGIGISLAALLAAVAQFSLSRKGLRFHVSMNAWQGLFNGTGSRHHLTENVDASFSDDKIIESEEGPESIAGAIANTSTSETTEPSTSNGKLEHLIIPVAVDSTQKEALKLLRSLKIIEDGVKVDELCTRREYARWLVQVNLLERSPKHRIIPSISLSGSRIAAFDDVNFEDPDFEIIQALAEAGVVPSKLSTKHSNSNGSETEKRLSFSPERFISRQDLINWKVQLEYEFVPEIIEQISRTKAGLMDVKKIQSVMSPEFFMDMLAGDRSIIRRVFGNSRRFQPNKPSTKAQAAVALTSGRMMEAIRSELSRIETENASRIAEMEEIRSELLTRGDIQRFWEEKLKEEEAHGLQVEDEYHATLKNLEEEQVLQEKDFQEHLKERAALDCQRQLLINLGEEVNEMSERFSSERTSFVAEQFDLHSVISELVMKHEGLLGAKSILEAEKEAVRILRSWVEDEARNSQSRAKVLEEVGRRWRWENQS